MRSVASPPDTAASYQSLALLDHLSRVARREADGAPEPDGQRPRHLVALTLLRDHGLTTLHAAERRLAGVGNKVLGALSSDEPCTLHALLIRAAGGQLPATACADPDTG